ncbi:MAG: hypothetical protein MK135_05380 [Polyangiaceae bacterium]|nr:hypothetical protein [Polyangiaceae bacterium]
MTPLAVLGSFNAQDKSSSSFSGIKSSPAGSPTQSGKSEAEKTHSAALQFEAIIVRQMLKPLEKSLSASMGEGGQSPMVGAFVVDALSKGISEGGGLGFASVIEEALRGQK